MSEDSPAPAAPRRQIVLVTGGARGIGRATARRFARGGAFVAVADRDGDDAAALVAELEAEGGRGSFRELDVTDLTELKDWVFDVGGRFGRIDVLVNNAGIVRDAILVKSKDGEIVSTLSEADFDAVIDVNLRAVFLCTREVVPFMLEGGGSILNATSIVARDGNFGQTNYAATKAGVVGMTRTWARELGRHGIRVNAVAPGFVDTEMLRSIPEERLQAIAARVPLGRLGHVDEVAEAYYWLASDAARYVSGQVLGVDGGAVHGT